MNSDISQLLSNTWGLLIVILFFCGAIFFHELGHFLAAKWRGLKIERFSIGFGPRLFGWRGKDGVDYRISLLPLGGYVALPQLADMRLIEGESETPVDSLPPIGYWDKIIVAVAGPLFNVILAFALAVIVWMVGYPTGAEMRSTTIGYIFPTLQVDEDTTVVSPAKKAGLQAGDKILKIDGNSVDGWNDIRKLLIIGSGRDDYDNPLVQLTIQRGEKAETVIAKPVLQEINTRSGKAIRSIGIAPAYPMVVEAVAPHSPAEKAGIKPGDTIKSVNGAHIYSVPQFNALITKEDKNPIRLGLERDGRLTQKTLTPGVLPLTKPLVAMRLSDGDSAYTWEFLPRYLSKDETTSLTAEADITVFERPQSGELQSIFPLGATIIAINGNEVHSLQALVDELNRSESDRTQIAYTKNGDAHTVRLNGRVRGEVIPPETYTMIGVTLDAQTVILHPNPFAQVQEQIEMTFSFIGSLFHPKSDIGVDMMSGPVGIGRVLHTFSLQDLRLAIWFSVLLNINLAILNLMPIPVLDGGHILIATISKITGRIPSVKFVGAIQGTMMLLLFGLMFYVLFNDSMDWIGDHEREQQFLREQEYRLPLVFKQAD